MIFDSAKITSGCLQVQAEFLQPLRNVGSNLLTTAPNLARSILEEGDRRAPVMGCSSGQDYKHRSPIDKQPSKWSCIFTTMNPLKSCRYPR